MHIVHFISTELSEQILMNLSIFAIIVLGLKYQF